MDDAVPLTRIEALIDDDHGLQREHGGPVAGSTRARLGECEVALEHHHPRAGEDPEVTVERPASTVEGYKQ